jgi:pyruvate ferredoxin oxidoreductase alpha subunit
VLYGQPGAPLLLSFIGGLGGRDLPPEELYQMFEVARAAVATGSVPEPRLLYTSHELRELRKLQAVALNERGQQP